MISHRVLRSDMWFYRKTAPQNRFCGAAFHLHIGFFTIGLFWDYIGVSIGVLVHDLCRFRAKIAYSGLFP